MGPLERNFMFQYRSNLKSKSPRKKQAIDAVKVFKLTQEAKEDTLNSSISPRSSLENQIEIKKSPGKDTMSPNGTAETKVPKVADMGVGTSFHGSLKAAKDKLIKARKKNVHFGKTLRSSNVRSPRETETEF